MRITGYGAGFGQGDANKRDRAAAFRARHSIGQRVKGRIERRDASGLYWVLVGGEELLARLEVNADPGDELFFIVRALSPEIMLQALPSGVEAADLPGLVQRFRAAREMFESQHGKLLQPLCALPFPSFTRRDAFTKALDAAPEALRQYAKVHDYLAQINALIAPEAKGQAMYEPWLLPPLRRLEMLRRPLPGAQVEFALSAVDSICGGLEARLTIARLRLFAERTAQQPACLDELLAFARELHGQEPEVLGPMRLTSSGLGGVLGELFGDVPAWSSGGLNTRV